MPITLTIDRAKKLAILKVTGNPSVKEIMGAFEAYYQGQPTRNLLWDFSEGSVASFSFETINRAVKQSLALAREYSETRQPGRTAAVTPKDIDYGIASQYVALSIDSPHRFKVCRSMAEAMKWLEGE